MKKVGVIGLGIMGKPMAQNLLKAGYEVMVRDLNPTPVEALVQMGAVAGSNQEIGRNCDVILLILPNGRIVQNVLFGRPGGISDTGPAGVRSVQRDPHREPDLL